MATATYSPSFSTLAGAEKNKPSFFAKIAKKFVDQRIAKARQMTAWYLNSYSDEKLAEFGWSAADIKRMRNAA